MLRKRSRSIQKDSQMNNLTMSDSNSESHFQSDHLGHNNPKNKSLFSVSGLFEGLSPKGLSDSDSVRSPTSPLDCRVFSIRSPKSPTDGNQKVWDCSKVGLSIVDSLDDDSKLSGKILRQSSKSKNILFGSRMRIKTPDYQTYTNSFEAPKSLPKSYVIFPHTSVKSPLHKGSSDVLFEIGETPLEPDDPFGKIRSYSLDSCRSFSAISGLADRKSNLSTFVNSPPQLIEGSPNSNNFSLMEMNSVPRSVGSANGFLGSLSASEIELSEDYTCVISHGPNPKTTHIFCDCILECHNECHTNDSSNFSKNEEKEIELTRQVRSLEIPSPYPSSDFLRLCFSCKKKLEGKDIYIYRGEKAFCSLNCRLQEIQIDEEFEETAEDSSEGETPKLESGQELFETGIFVAT